MSIADFKTYTESAKNAGSLLGQVGDYIDSIGDDFEQDRWVRGTAKTLAGITVGGAIVYVAHGYVTSPSASQKFLSLL